MDHLIRKAPPEAVDFFAVAALILEMKGHYGQAQAVVEGLKVKVWRAPVITEL